MQCTGRPHRCTLWLKEAELWVGGGLLAASALHLGNDWPVAYATTAWTLAGGVLLGLGALVNGACVFGAVARLGSGQWAYALNRRAFSPAAGSPALPSAGPRARPVGALANVYRRTPRRP